MRGSVWSVLCTSFLKNKNFLKIFKKVLDNRFEILHNSHSPNSDVRAVSSAVEHCLHTAGVTGSNPVSRTSWVKKRCPGGGMVDAVDSKSTGDEPWEFESLPGHQKCQDHTRNSVVFLCLNNLKIKFFFAKSGSQNSSNLNTSLNFFRKSRLKTS